MQRNEGCEMVVATKTTKDEVAERVKGEWREREREISTPKNQ